MLQRSTHNGFTLIELLVVIAIIGILAAIVMVALGDSRAKARNAAVLTQMDEYQKALELYYAQTGAYPATTLSRTARYCMGDNPAASCMGSITSSSADDNSAINVALRTHMSSLPRFAQPSGGLDYSSPAYSGCTGTGMGNDLPCDIGDYSFWFVLEGTNSSCGRAQVADSSLSGVYTLCRLTPQ